MPAVMPQGAQVMSLNSMLGVAGGFADNWRVRLFSNNIIPDLTDTTGSYTEVSGGGYVNVLLNKALFIVTPGNPSQALYNTFVDFNFTGPTNAPGTIYGYFITDGNNDLVCSERFLPSQVPFVPIVGSLIRITPKITAASVNP